MNKNSINFPEATWTMPFLFTEGMLFIPLLSEILGDDFIKAVGSVYGAPQCLFAGGRPTLLNIKNIKNVEKVVASVLHYNITPSFTLTNTNLTPEELKDSYSNDLLKIINDAKANAIVCSDLLFEYIKEKYTDIKPVASVIKSVSKTFSDTEEETQYINSLIDLYDKVVIRSEYFNRNEKLTGIKDVSKIVILVNSTCKPDCPYSKRHYDLISKFHRHEVTYKEGFDEFQKYCPKINEKGMKENLLTYEQVANAVKTGVRYLKFQGRQLTFNELFRSMCNYNFFSKELNKEELRQKIDNLCAEKLQKSLDLQMYSVMKGV